MKRSTGVVEGNECSNNGQSGFSVADPGTDPLLRKNESRENKKHGIEFSYGSGGRAEDNVCERNGSQRHRHHQHGHDPDHAAQPLRGQPAARHRLSPTARPAWQENNVSENNVGSGFAIFDNGTNPTLRGNDSRQNKLHGVDCERGSVGVIEGNTIESNDACGGGHFRSADLADRAGQPILNNKQFGIYIVNGATPKIDPSNKITGNKMGATSRR